MSGPFQVGDVVVCVKRSGQRTNSIIRRVKGSRLRAGKFYTIRRSFVHAGIPAVLLNEIEPVKGFVGFPADRFRHLPRATEEFTAQMRALRPIKVEEPA